MQVIISGLAFGSIYAVIGVGVVFIWRCMNVLNFAHGQFLALGAYITIILFHRWLGLSIIYSLLIALFLVGMAGALFAGTLFQRLRRQPLLAVVVSTMGLSLLIENAVLLIFGPRPHSFSGFFGRRMIWIGTTGFLANHLVAFAFALVFLASLGFVLRYTMVGKVIRSIAFDRETSGLLGIPVPRFTTFTFALSTILAAIAGVLVVPVTYLSVDLGTAVGFKTFAGLVIGGFGSVSGAIIGGPIVGLLEAVGTLALGTRYRDLFCFVALILVLLIRPQGLIGVKEAERV